jgi:hypothetical protein
MLLNLDDQAGFRLDTTFTHKSHGQLGVNQTVTTNTDFVNKHPCQLQTTCYNFTKTTTTNEICAGVVKTSVIHDKSPSQHAADLQMLLQKDLLKSVFFNPSHSDEASVPKDIHFIKVDGASDEGPTHVEVQFLWTELHISTPTKVTLVSTRSSGDSFLNRVELQNGCLARGHSNLFIPSTLLGAPCNDDGSFSTEKHKANMSKAVEQYIARVDETSCMKTTIKLYRGAENHEYVQRREQLLTFLQGNKMKKDALKKNNPTLYKYF